ncbi:hypothetical protein OFW50_02185 [Lacticaseibacillus chiayiensis]|uniref:DUF1642 domain-containing protein n=1 Tax=Lacticaseibacillus chiayiensis TaxID=2100821 RepID=A0ABY6H8Y8_9LACO|nr:MULTISPECIES: hypothetical protein [Lacticaseibacillus]MDG3060352.1 hypothetical protein [Lacticaseibacillus sp. BCRC 81376]MDG3060409.1 hypothetical protein [Lacticaseibacillus sp. BCRC 81376]UYN56934.1 hypothetical protein OFW50_02185 [Lacticaseibacillus chiayiensis]
MTETKRDVLEKLAECYAEVSDAYTSETGSPYYCGDEPNYLEEYGTSLPDDLPVIPKAVGEILRSARGQTNLLDVLDTSKNGHKISETLAWIIANQNTFALAWTLGVWRVEETGEIVKLEAEK